MYNFIKFTKISQRSEDRITITSSFSFGFPTKFFKDNGINNFKYVVIYYDKESMAIGFNFTNDEAEKYKFSISKSKQGYGGNIIATSFFKTNSLNSKELKGRYEWSKQTMEGVGDLFVINLKKKDQSPAVPEQ
jgi:hypothetical protein